METLPVEREYPYRERGIRLYLVPPVATAMTLFAVHHAILGTGIRPLGFALHGILARLVWLAAGFCTASVGCLWVWRLWKRVLKPNHRIGFTSTGVLMPAPDNLDKETLIRFDDILSIGILAERNSLTSDVESLTCIRLVTQVTVYPIHARKLRDGEFDEIVVWIADNVDGRATAGIDPDLWFDRATKLEMAGEWYLAFRYYSIAARRLKGTQNGEYAVNCVRRLQEKINLTATASTSDGDAT